MPAPEQIIYDWNTEGLPRRVERPFEVHDETLRDGIQCPSVTDPPVEAKLEILHLVNSLGVASSDLALPAAGERAYRDGLALVQEIARHKLQIRPAMAGRTLVNDIRPIADIAQKTGLPVEVMAFLGSSPIRAYAEAWELDRLLKLTAEAVEFGVKEGLPFNFVTEDTVRSLPTTLTRLFQVAIDHGADRLTLCDTVGHATPEGVHNLITFTRNFLRGLGVTHVRVDWHGHNDRGLALPNALAAVDAGVDRVHGTALGIGERVGNTQLDQLLINLKLAGRWEPELTNLRRLSLKVSDACHFPIPRAYPAMGSDAFRTGTGVHAAAVIKAEKKGDTWLADRIYSGVPAAMFGLRQEIEIGHMSGESNVIYWLERHEVKPDKDLVKAILTRAKETNRVLETEEIFDLIRTLHHTTTPA